MSSNKGVLLSVVVPVYNEGPNLEEFNKSLTASADIAADGSYEIIYCDDGSTDNTSSIIRNLIKQNKKISLLSLSRNFGKEIATTAGIHHAVGRAIMTIDADGQHPVELIIKFVNKWQRGAKVVVGIRTANRDEGFIKKIGSSWFYKIFNRLTGLKLVPGSDYRLIDHTVQQEFNQMSEHSRIIRGMVDWLGYEREFIHFKANSRMSGDAGYSLHKLVKLAVDSVISMSKSPLYLSAYLGGIIVPLSVLIGLFMVGDAVLSDPLNLNATGSAYLVVLLVFLVGILLVSQAIIGLYLSHIHTETQNRPLYIIDNQKSVGIND